jgi:hypothetical protein
MEINLPYIIYSSHNMAEMLLKVTINTKEPTELYFFIHLLLPMFLDFT